jgi:hypothetical protein
MVTIPKIREKRGPEFKIQKAIIRYLRQRDWFVRATHGNQYQRGFPDLFAAKRRYGMRWIEVKNPASYKFTDAQLECFPKFSSNNVGIWILTAGTDVEYDKLFGSPNWASYLPVAQVYTRNRQRKTKERVEKRKAGRGPERDLQDEIIAKLEADKWFVLETHGSLYQSGFPDLYACKKHVKGSDDIWGQRWIECKIKEKYEFTGRQLETFPRMMAEGVGVWVATSANEVFDVIEGKPNWTNYL